MARFGTVAGCLMLVWIAGSGCSGDDDPEQPHGAGSAGSSATTGGAGTTGGMGGSGGSGNCDERGCWVTLTQFQAEALNCAADHAAALDEYRNEPGEECTYAIFECGGLSGAAYQYGFTGDNVQCYYDEDGELVGGVRTSDHGASTLFGEVPSPGCYAGPICGDAGVSGDAGGEDDLRGCQVNSDCVIVPTECCVCGEPEPEDVTAVRRDRAAQFQAELCAEPIACPLIECPTVPPRYVASCREHVCVGYDLKAFEATDCEAASDCHVRAVECCECGASLEPGHLVAVSNDQAFSGLVCDPQQACDGCAPVYDEQITVSCDATQHCTLDDPRAAF